MCAAVAIAILGCPLRSWSQTAPVLIPSKEGEGYAITRCCETDAKTGKAPDGYEGRIETSKLTAVGNTPATMGKTIVATFRLSNQIKICPSADGTAEGTGVFSLSLDYTDKQANGTSRLHIEMKADGKYKGEVGDDAWLVNPVKAEIDYTYTVTGSIRDASGAIATPAGTNVAQHITIPFTVGNGLSAPGISAFSGGDPTRGRYSEAVGAGTALTFWGGVFYSMAQADWRTRDRCVNTFFTPPSDTVRLVLGGKTTVSAEIKTKAGESVKARFFGARVFSSRNSVTVNDGSVTPTEGSSDTGAPMKFTFTAPTQKVDRTGFLVSATSRAGVSEGTWSAGLGTDWSGRISLTSTNTGDDGDSELLTWSSSSASGVTVELKNGKGWAYGYTEVHDLKRFRQKAATGGGGVTLISQATNTIDGAFTDSAEATVEVIYPSSGVYAIRVSTIFTKEGKAHVQMCNRNTGCRDSDAQLLLGGPLGVDGKIEDPNHLRGSKTEVKKGTGSRGTGTVTTTITWDLAREGKSQ